jgi:hypothetical protein
MQINLRRLPGPNVEELHWEDEMELVALTDLRKPPANPYDVLAKLSPDLPQGVVEELLAVSDRGLEAVRDAAIDAGPEVRYDGGRTMPAMAWKVLAWLQAAERALADRPPQELRVLVAFTGTGSEELPPPRSHGRQDAGTRPA